VEAGTADAETDPEASEIVRARAAVVAGTRTGPGIVRSGRKSASNAGRSARSTDRSARSTGRHGRSAGKSASNAGTTASKRAAESLEVGENPKAGAAPGSIGPGSPAGAPTTTLPAPKARRRP
jgi:hypothetical protein